MKHIQSIVGVFLSMALVAPVPHALAEDVTKPQSPLTSEEWRLYQELSQRIKAHYVEPVDEQRLLKGCLSGMARELDAHSAYLPPVSLKNSSGDMESPAGIGLTLGIRNNRPQVIATLEDAPAARVDIRRGDVLARIDGELVLDLSLDEVIHRLRGQAGSLVRIGLLRGESPDIIEHGLKRELITNKSVKSRRLEPGYGYIHINAIHRDTPKALIKALQTLYPAGQAKARGLVLDLRDSPGGLLDRSLALAATFLPEDSLLLSTKGQAENSTTTWRATKDALGGLLRSQSRDAPAVMKDLPLVVLVNGGTAAGAEIVAGALQDHQRAVLIGTPTFGKDSLQNILPLSNDGAVKLTVERWRTPKGRTVSPAGLVPDIVIGTDVGTGAAADPVLEKALAILKEKALVLDQTGAALSNLDDLRTMALSASLNHDAEQAIALWSQLLARKPDDNQALRWRGSLHAELGRHEQARVDHQRAVEQEPDSSLAWNSSCWSSILVGSFASAQVQCEKAHALEPGDMAATVNLGHTHLLRGDKASAWAWYEKAAPLLANEAELTGGPLADFELFKKRGWQPELVQAGYNWFASEGRAWLGRRAAADKLLVEAKSAEAAKDRTTELRLRVERLAELERLLPHDNPLVLRAVEAVADTHIQLEQPAQALPLYLRVLEYRKDLTGNRPKPLLITFADITKTLAMLDQPELAIPALEQLLPVLEKRWGKDDPATQSLINRLASEYIQAKQRPDRSLALAERVLTYQVQHDTPMAKRLDASLNAALALKQLGRHAEAIRYLKESLRLSDKVHGPNSRNSKMVEEDLVSQWSQLAEKVKNSP